MNRKNKEEDGDLVKEERIGMDLVIWEFGGF